MLDVEKISKAVYDSVSGMLSPLAARIKALEDRPPAKDGRDGKDVDYLLVSEMVGKAVAAIPVPKDGKDADPQVIAAMVKGEVADAVAAIRIPADGKDGKDADPVDYEVVAGLVDKAVARIPVPQNGKDGAPGERGADGKDGQPGERGEPGITGKDGAHGKDGRDGIDGKDGMPGDRGQDGKDGAPGERGQDGLNGKDGTNGLNGKDGADGVDGKDGTPGKDCDYGVVAKMMTETIERHMPDIIAKAAALIPKPADGRDGLPGRDGIGTKGEDGKNGRDGFTPDDLELSVGDDGRTVIVTLRTADREVSKSITLPVPLDRGVFKAGPYQKGDGVTHGGSFWIAQRSVTAEDIPGRSDAWRLAVKRGTDGK